MLDCDTIVRLPDGDVVDPSLVPMSVFLEHNGWRVDDAVSQAKTILKRAAKVAECRSQAADRPSRNPSTPNPPHNPFLLLYLVDQPSGDTGEAHTRGYGI